MNLIIVRDARSTPWRIDLESRRSRLIGVGAVAGGALCLMLLGFIAALIVSGADSRAKHELSSLRTDLSKQREQLANLDNDSHRNLDGLALQLGQLQAQATRLNALGDRLTQIGKLDDGEFDFASAPAMGGPEEPANGVAASLPIQNGVDALRAEFDHQEIQLDVLENLLRDRKIESTLLPSGMPVAQGYISSGFGDRTDPLDGHPGVHLGLDFAAPLGTDITAVGDGVVTWSGPRTGYGNVIEIDHGNGYMTRYAHNSLNIAEVGTRVHEGQLIAKVGSTGRSTGAHCHFEVWLNGKPVNPMVYVKSTRATHA